VQLLAIALLNSSFHFQKCLSNFEYLSTKYCFMFCTGASTNSMLANVCLHFLFSCFIRFLLFIDVLRAFWKYRLDNLSFFRSPNYQLLSAWENFQYLQTAVVFHCFAPCFCGKQCNNSIYREQKQPELTFKSHIPYIRIRKRGTLSFWTGTSYSRNYSTQLFDVAK